MGKLFLIIYFLVIIPITALAKTETAIFAGGCFWCLEADFDKLPGVLKTESGYDGGTKKNPTYKIVSAGNTNYAEAVKVSYNPKIVSYQKFSQLLLASY